VKPLLIACDFDGTITQRDTLHVVVERYGEADLWATFEVPLREGRMTVEEAMEAEFAAVRATPDEVRDTVRTHAPVRDGFAQLVTWCEARGHRFVVMSNGFRSVIAPVLADAGLDHLPIVANDATFRIEGTTIHWSDRGERCGVCQRPCKRQPLRELHRGEEVVFIGDGISDRCVSAVADVVFARDFLAEHCSSVGTAFHAFSDFHDVRRHLEAAEVAA
jgi:2-hydroxy-3-keto-5-methylthiopentenyl-1-phosphate phosphatase